MTEHKKVFISYRRADTAGAVRAISGSLKEAFGDQNIFVDNQSIEFGSEWPHEIQNTLSDAAILLVALGQNWLKLDDEFGRRRIDLPDDWVKNEIAVALKQEKIIIPVLFDGAAMPVKRALPYDIQKLCDHRYFEIRYDFWKQDVLGIIEVLEQCGCLRTRAKVRYPKPHKFPNPLGTAEIENVLVELNAGIKKGRWTIVTSVIPGEEPKTRSELTRSYEFERFGHAIAFMSDAVPFIESINHHPRWENVFKTVTVWLTSWDIGFTPSILDADLARKLDQLYDLRKRE